MIMPVFDSGTYKGLWSIPDERIQQVYANGDKHILNRLNKEIAIVFENILLPYRESKKYLVGDYILPKGKTSKEAEPLLITEIKEEIFVLFSEEKKITREIMFEELFEVELCLKK